MTLYKLALNLPIIGHTIKRLAAPDLPTMLAALPADTLKYITTIDVISDVTIVRGSK